jgi:MFS family permease
MTATAVQQQQQQTGLLGRPYALMTIGSWSLIFLAAFESLAVTTIMPIVTADLNGRALYALAFSATLAAGVIGMVLAGTWADSRGPARPLLTAIGLFALGLALAGTATSMGVFVAGRFLQGLGGGGITVALYVMIAGVYPSYLHIKIFGAYASAWVVPSMVGPFVAGAVAEAFSWHWVFLGVVALVVVATAMILPSLPGHGRNAAAVIDAGRLLSAVVLAVAVVALSSAVQLDGWAAWALAPAAVLAVGLSARRLVPVGTFRARPGLPAAVLLGGAAGAVFFGTEVYLPLLLHDRYGVPAWLSGITLTAAAIAWALAAAVQGRLGDRLDPSAALRAGAVLLTAGAAVELLTAGLHLPPVAAAVGWFLAGAGMGTLYPRISTLVLAYSEPGHEGFNTAAKSITDAVGGGTSLALAGLLFAALGDTTARTPYVGVLAFTTLIGLVVVLLAGRAGQTRETATLSR